MKMLSDLTFRHFLLFSLSLDVKKMKNLMNKIDYLNDYKQWFLIPLIVL